MSGWTQPTHSDDLEQFLADLPINLTDASDEDLQSVAQAATDAMIAFRSLSAIATAIATARANRLAGHVQRALDLEQYAERNIDTLPECLKW